MASNEISIARPLGAEIGSVRTTLDMGDEEGKLKVFSVLQDSENLRDHINEQFGLIDVVQERVEFTNEETGDVEPQIRTILIADDGQAYHATSSSLASSVQRLFSIFGDPRSWYGPKEVKAIEKKSVSNGMRRYIQLVPVLTPKVAKTVKK